MATNSPSKLEKPVGSLAVMVNDLAIEVVSGKMMREIEQDLEEGINEQSVAIQGAGLIEGKGNEEGEAIWED